jgi:hypothetical protein
METAELERGIGDNNPPMTPYEQSLKEINDLYDEAVLWLDGEPVTTQEHADGIGRLVGMLREAKKLADERRKEEAKPFDEGKAEVQARYNPLIQDKKGKVDLAMEACKKALQPFLDAEQARIDAEAKAAREAADEAQRLAREALQSSQPDNLAEREAAEALLTEANKLQASAKKAEGSTAKVAGTGRALSQRVRYMAEIDDPVLVARHYWQSARAEVEAFFLALAQQDVTAGNHKIPGVRVVEEKTVA